MVTELEVMLVHGMVIAMVFIKEMHRIVISVHGQSLTKRTMA